MHFISLKKTDIKGRIDEKREAIVNASDARFVTNTERKYLIDVRLKSPEVPKNPDGAAENLMVSS